MVVEFFVTLADWVVSIAVSAYNIVTHLGISLVGYLLIFLGIVIAVRVLKTVNARIRLYRKMKKLFRKKELSCEILHSRFRSIFWRFSPYEDPDVRFFANGKTYEIKIFPGIYKGCRVLFGDDKTVTVSRFFLKRKIAWSFPAPSDEATEAVLVFSPAPRGFFEPVHTSLGTDVFPLDGGRSYEGYIFFPQNAFLRQLDRILDGYVDSFLFENQKSEDE